MKTIFELIISEKQAEIFKSMDCEVKFIEKFDEELWDDDSLGEYEITTDDPEDLIGKLLDRMET
jgi:hypothetical protein